MKLKALPFITLAVAVLLIGCGKSDADLQKAAMDKLTAAHVTGVTVVVNDGVATLTGEVADNAVKTSAEASARVEGVKSVTSNITIKPPPVSPAADPMLKAKLDDELKQAGCTGIRIETREGTVTASGSVPDAKYAECVFIISRSGLGKLDNQIVMGK